MYLVKIHKSIIAAAVSEFEKKFWVESFIFKSGEKVQQNIYLRSVCTRRNAAGVIQKFHSLFQLVVKCLCIKNGMREKL